MGGYHQSGRLPLEGGAKLVPQTGEPKEETKRTGAVAEEDELENPWGAVPLGPIKSTF